LRFPGTKAASAGLILCKRNACPLFSLSGNPIRFPQGRINHPGGIPPIAGVFLSLSNQFVVAATLCHIKAGASTWAGDFSDKWLAVINECVQRRA
jgi:hypothetical protein